MKAKLLAVLTLVLTLCAKPCQGQSFPGAYCPPGRMPQLSFPNTRTTPLQTLLFVKISGPEGMKVTFYRGGNQSVTLDAPFVVGFRPGYFYRIELSNMKRFPGQTFYPTLEVRGSLLLGGNLRACDWPAGLAFKEDDFLQAIDMTVVKKVIFVEKVENAIPETSSPDHPLELVVPRPRDPIEEARERGLPVLIVEMGSLRVPTKDLLCQAIAGTMLLPGDSFLPRPPVLPCLPWSCCPIYDPLLGPAPWLYYSLPDGGDWGESVGYDNKGWLRGLNPADTIARYRNSYGDQKIAVSNRVCLCIPRFLVAKTGPGGPRPALVEAPLSPNLASSLILQDILQARSAPSTHEALRHLELVREKMKASGVEKLQVTAVTGVLQNLDVAVIVTRPTSVTGVPEKEKAGPAPEGKDVPLKVDKWPDCCGAKVGDVVTFYVRYTNLGGQPIRDVIVSDNLISRFEYVKGSAQTSRSARFTVQPNEVGSSILQWEIDGVLMPKESGTVSFKVRIR